MIDYIPTVPSPAGPSKFLFKAQPARHAEMRYKAKLINRSGITIALPMPNAIAANANDL